MQKSALVEPPRLVGLVELFQSFKPCAYWIPALRLVMVARKDSSYVADRINDWSEIHWENHRPWWKPWKKCVGFSIYCPPQLRFSEDIPVVEVLDSVFLMDPNAFGEYKKLFYRFGKNLIVSVPK